MQTIDVFSTSVVLAYPNGSGGNRLRYMLAGKPWNLEPGHHFLVHPEVRLDGISTDKGYSKWPGPNDTEVEDPSLSCYPILTTHGMKYQTLKKIFPNRKIIKIYCNLKYAFLRHYIVFGKQFIIDHSENKEREHTLEDLERYIKWNLDYYRDNIDFEHDYAVCISPGRGPFEDFMCNEFSLMQHAVFDEAWRRISPLPEYSYLANLPVLETALALEKP